ncbi:MAG: DUF3737 family protein [Eubacterium sp.]|nr:DUF3737 family protein [Eubacterium sp.]
MLYTEERPLFMSDGCEVISCTFKDGESPLKESKNITVKDSNFIWRYPLWYCKNVKVFDTEFGEGSRAGMWYTDNLFLKNCRIASPKNIRRCDGVHIEDTEFTDGVETLWACNNVTLKNVKTKGDYLLMNSENVYVESLELDGKYSFDGVKNVEIRNSRLITKDAFWNSKNVTVYDSYIFAEYLGWNSENLTLVNCTIESLQGLCYIKNLKMVNCKTVNTDLAFEYSTVEVELDSDIVSIKNPISGRISAESIGEVIFDDKNINPGDTEIIVKKR